MAKVLKPGEPWHVEAKCKGVYASDRGCGATILLTAFDIYHRYDGETYHKTFLCPDCGVESRIATRTSPAGSRPKETAIRKIRSQWKTKAISWKNAKKMSPLE